METTGSASALPAGWRANDILRAMREDETNRQRLRIANASDAAAETHGRTGAVSNGEEGDKHHG